jgi:hypothetical protein
MSVERAMRDAELRCDPGTAGDMTFRLQLPLGRERANFRRAPTASSARPDILI